jgi:hypothetical protein
MSRGEIKKIIIKWSKTINSHNNKDQIWYKN